MTHGELASQSHWLSVFQLMILNRVSWSLVSRLALVPELADHFEDGVHSQDQSHCTDGLLNRGEVIHKDLYVFISG
jgi:hypothetical protein